MAAIPGRPDPWKTLGKLIAALIAAGVLVAGIALPYVGGLGLVAGHEADKFQSTSCNLQESKPPQKTTLYARDGKTALATLFSQDRVEIGLDEVPKVLQDALIATEDRKFYSHHGVDLRGLIRAAVNTTSGDTQGGSTLTMQYVKQLRYYEAGDDQKKQQAAVDQNLNRKIEDAKCAIYIEENLKKSKRTILQDYLNIAFFGENSYGIQTAARTYFNKPASELKLEESALLVGMLRAPSAYDPFVNRVAAKDRRDEVIQNLVAVGKLSQRAANAYKAKPISLATDAPPKVKQGCANSVSSVPNVGFFCAYVQDWLERNEKLTPKQQQTGGYKIVTTLDPAIQTSAQKQLQQAVPAKAASTAVLPVVDPRTGDILAMASSKNYGTAKYETEQPLFTARAAQGASTYKLFPLLTALQTGVPADFALDSLPDDNAYKVKNCLTTGTVKNNDEGSVAFSRNETLSGAMAKSSNTYFVRLADDVLGCHLQPIIDLAKKLGITSFDMKDGDKSTIGETIVNKQRAQQLTLGSVPTSPLEITGAYAGIANEGKFNAPAPVLSITDTDGSALPVKRTPAVQVVAPQTAARAVDILKGDTRAGGTSASQFAGWYSSGDSTIAGKTGTQQADPKSTLNSSIWFVGLTPKFVATSAVINYDNPSAPNSGLPGIKTGKAYGDYASKVWLKALRPSLGNDKWTWPGPNSVGGKPVPDVEGESLSEAKRDIESAGFKFVRLGSADGLLCPSSQPTEQVAYYGPHLAPAGSTVTVCASLGTPPQTYSPPPPKKHDRGHRSGGTHDGGGSGSGGGGRGGGRGGGGGNSHGPPGPGGR